MPVGKKRAPATPEFAESTMQLPIGVGSGIDALLHKELTTAEYAVLAFHTCYSNWDSGITYWTSSRRAAKAIGVSKTYVIECQKRLMQLGHLEIVKMGIRGRRYKINPHISVAGAELPTDANGKPLKMAVPFGIGSIFERLKARDIHWKDMVVWLVLRRSSDWVTGVTAATGLSFLAKQCRMALRTLSACLERLTEAGLLKRINLSNVRSVFQLFPKLPKPKPKPAAPEKPETSTGGCIRDGEFWMSRNKRVKQSTVTNKLFQRIGRKWVEVRDKDRYTIPKMILRDLQAAVDITAQIRAALC